MNQVRSGDAGSRRARSLAWAIWSIGVLFVGISFLFILATLSVYIPSREFGFRGWVPIVAALWLTIGARIAARQPRISVGWLILSAGFLWSINAMFEEYSVWAYFPQEIDAPLVPQAVWFDNMVGTLVAGLSALALLHVPDGRLPSRRWIPLAIAVVVSTILSATALAVLPRRLVPFPFDNPFGLEILRAPDATVSTVLHSLEAIRGLEVLLPTGALLLRLRNSKGIQRQQLKWVAYVASFTSVLVFLYAFVNNAFVQYAQILGIILVPIAFGIAMRRYRLYDIDRILDHTIVMGGATALLAGLYVASIGLIQRLFVTFTGERSDAAIVLTTLLAAAAFTPLKDRIQGLVRRTFASEIPGTRGLELFTNELDAQLRLSDGNLLLAQLLAESVESLGAVAGAVETSVVNSPHALRVIGPWTGDAHLIVDVACNGALVARVLLGPRANGGTYDAAARERVERAARLVGCALECLDRRLPIAPAATMGTTRAQVRSPQT